MRAVRALGQLVCFAVVLLSGCLLLPSTASAQAFTLSGSIELPAGRSADEDISFSVQARRTPTFVLVSSSPAADISAGTTSADFSMTISDARNNGEDWTLVYFCNSGCEGLGTPGVHNEATGTQLLIPGFEATTFTSDTTDIVFPILKGDIISGSISLPNDQVAPAGGLQVRVRLVNTVNPFEFVNGLFLTIPENANSVDYSITSDLSDTDNRYRISYDCDSSCEGLYLDRGFSAGAATVVAESDAVLVNGGSDVSPINLTLLSASQISGEVVMPDEVATPAGGLSLRVNAVDVDDTSTSISQTITIDENSDRQNYSIPIPGNTSARWLVTYSCNNACEGFSRLGNRYSDQGTVTAFEAQTLLTGSLSYGDINFNVLEERTISGTVSLPGGAVADEDISVQVFVSDQNDIAQVNSTGVTILSGESSVAYELEMPDLANLETDYRVRYSCSSCTLFQTSGFYTTTGTVSNFSDSSTVADDADQNNIDLTLLPPTTISGSISVPGATLTTPLMIEVVARNRRDPNDRQATQVTVPANDTNAAAFSVPISSSDRDQWFISYECPNGCPGFLQPAFFAADNGATVNSGDADEFEGGTDVTGIQFSLLASRRISGTISYPDDVQPPAEGAMIQISARDENVTTTPFVIVQQTVTVLPSQVADQAASIDYVLDTVPDDNAAWRVSYSCLSGCDGIVDGGFYSSTGTVSNFGDITLLEVADLPFDNIDLDLIKADTISGTLSLNSDQVAPAAGFPFRITVDSGPSTPIFFEFVTIEDGQNSVDYSVKTISDDNVNWRVQHSCAGDCGSNVIRGFYAGDTTTPLPDESLALSGGNDHFDINMETLAAFEISGMVALPANEVAPLGGFEVSIDAFDSVNQEFSQIRPTIPQGMNSTPYSLPINPDESARWRVRYSCFNQPQCVGKLDSADHVGSPVGTGEGLATQFVGGQDHPNVLLTILNGRTISGSVSLPGGQLAQGEDVVLSVSVLPMSGPFVSSDSRRVVIEVGQNSADYTLDASLEASEPWIARYRCDSGCGNFVDQGFFSASGTQSDQSAATPLGPDQDHPNTDFTLLNAVEFSGSLNLPAPVTGDAIFRVIAEQTQSNERVSQVLEFVNGSDSMAFMLTLPAQDSTEWRLSYSCDDNCDGFVRDGFLGDAGTELNQEDARLLSSDETVSGLTLNVIQSFEFAGTFRFPNLATVQQETPVQLTIEGTTVSDSQIIRIAQGANSGAFSLMLPGSASGEALILSYDCLGDCPRTSRQGFFNSTGGEFLQENAETLDFDASLAAIDFVGAPQIELSGSININPDDIDLASGDIRFEVVLDDLNSEKSEVLSVDVLNGQTSGDFAFFVDPDPSVDWLMSYSCISESDVCQPFFDGFYRNSAPSNVTVKESEVTLLPAEVERTDLDMTVLASFTVTGSVSLRPEELAPAGGITLLVGLQRDTMTQDPRDNIFVRAFIPEGERVAAYESKISPDADTEWIASYQCELGCDGLIQRGFFSRSGTRPFLTSVTLLDGGRDHASINLRILEGETISGTVSLLQGEVASGGGVELEISAFDVAANSGFAELDITTRIPAGQNSAPYSITVPSSTASRWRISYQCQITCLGYAPTGIYNSAGTVINTQDAELLAGGQAREGIDMLVLHEDAQLNDDDGDGVLNDADNCQFIPNQDQADSNRNGLGDLCDDEGDAPLCVPIRATNGAIALICV